MRIMYTYVKLFKHNPHPDGIPLTDEQIRNKVPLAEQINEYMEHEHANGNMIQIEHITHTPHSMSVVTESLVVFGSVIGIDKQGGKWEL